MEKPVAKKLSTLEECQTSALQLALNARRQLIIFTPDLEPDLYNNQAFFLASLNLLKRSKHTEIHILIQDSYHALESAHILLKLLHYTDYQFQIRKFNMDPALQETAYLISDDHHLLRRQNTRVYQGMCYTNDRARVKNQLEDFKLLWNVSAADPNLRPLTL